MLVKISTLWISPGPRGYLIAAPRPSLPSMIRQRVINNCGKSVENVGDYSCWRRTGCWLVIDTRLNAFMAMANQLTAEYCSTDKWSRA
jgi:hypothetical protein